MNELELQYKLKAKEGLIISRVLNMVFEIDLDKIRGKAHLANTMIDNLLDMNQENCEELKALLEKEK